MHLPFLLAKCIQQKLNSGVSTKHHLFPPVSQGSAHLQVLGQPCAAIALHGLGGPRLGHALEVLKGDLPGLIVIEEAEGLTASRRVFGGAGVRRPPSPR